MTEGRTTPPPLQSGTRIPLVPRQSAPHPAQDWADVMGPGETPLWQGAPQHSARKGWKAEFPLLAFIAIALVMAANAGGGAGTIAPLVMAGFVGWKLLQRRKGDTRSLTSSYLLTDAAAYIRNGSAIQRHPITAHMPLTLTSRGVHFAFRTKGHNDDPREVPYGFANIPDAETVYSLMLDLKKAAR